MQAAEANRSAGGEHSAALQEQVELLQQSAEEQEKEFGDLLACLGQESAKVAALQELLDNAGIDAGPVLERVEAEYLGEEDDGADAQDDAEGGLFPGHGTDAHADEQNAARPAHDDAAAAAPAAGHEGDIPAMAGENTALPDASAEEQTESSLEGLPDGELLSPPWKQPRLPQAQSSKIAASIPSSGLQPLGHDAEPALGGAAVQGIDFDGWDADDNEWNIS